MEYKRSQSAQIAIALDTSIAQVTPLPLVAKGVYSLVSDMKLGWKPQTDQKPKYLYEVPPVVAFKYLNDDYYVPVENKVTKIVQYGSPSKLGRPDT